MSVLNETVRVVEVEIAGFSPSDCLAGIKGMLMHAFSSEKLEFVETSCCKRKVVVRIPDLLTEQRRQQIKSKISNRLRMPGVKLEIVGL